MSLKDRLNTAQTKPAQQIKQDAQPNYYNSNNEAQMDTLGALDILLADDDLNNIFVSGAKNIYLERKGKINKSTSTFRDNIQLENIIRKIAQNEGIELDEFNPSFEFNYETGINVLATLPPLSNIPTIFVKCYKDKHAQLQTLQLEHSVSKEIALILEAFCTIKKNILIIGDKNTLKTTLLSALAKKTPNNNRVIIIDSENEIKIQAQNCTNYNFSKIKNSKTANTLLDSILSTNPDKIYINTKNEEFLSEIIKKIQSGYRGLNVTFLANNPQEAIEKISIALSQNNPQLTLEKAKAMSLKAFDIIITTQKDEIGRRKVSTISEINLLSEKEVIKDIFTLDYSGQHQSTGITPSFYEDIKLNSLPIGDNIFYTNYKHTYHKNANLENQIIKRNANIDILKKFKKDLPTSEVSQNEINEQKESKEETQKELNAEELMQKAQEKFDELKKNVQIQGEFELKLEDFEENKDENI